MLTYLDGGAHTCCVYDGEGNTGCDRTEIFIKGVRVVCSYMATSCNS